MALARVQAATNAGAGLSSISTSFAAPPTVGNGITVAVITGSAITTTCTDNRGNAYYLAITRTGGSGDFSIFYCPQIIATGTPFTITITFAGATNPRTAIIEVSGVNFGLLVDKTISAIATSTTPATGSTAALANNEVFVVSGVSTIFNIASATVESVSPTWVQEAEGLTNTGAGEINSRVLTGVIGTTQSCSWTIGTSRSWAAALATFYASSSLNTAKITQDIVEVLSQPVPAARIGQYSVEVLSATTPVPGRVTQYSVEVLSQNLVVSAGTETTQFFVIMP